MHVPQSSCYSSSTIAYVDLQEICIVRLELKCKLGHGKFISGGKAGPDMHSAAYFSGNSNVIFVHSHFYLF